MAIFSTTSGCYRYASGGGVGGWNLRRLRLSGVATRLVRLVLESRRCGPAERLLHVPVRSDRTGASPYVRAKI